MSEPVSMDGPELRDVNMSGMDWELVPQARKMLEELEKRGEGAYTVMLQDDGLQKLFSDDEKLSQMAARFEVWIFLFYRLKRVVKQPRALKQKLNKKSSRLRKPMQGRPKTKVASTSPPST